MKPFNLEEAKAGKKVVTRDGREYKFGAHNPDARFGWVIIGWVDNIIESHKIDGRNAETPNGADLFMAEEEVWVNQEPKHEAIHQYEDMLTRLHGDSALVYVSNFDDVYHGWDVMVEPFVMLRFMVRMAEPYAIRIEVYETAVLEMKVHKTTVFHGGLPGDKESNPDFEFIEKILVNINCFL